MLKSVRAVLAGLLAAGLLLQTGCASPGGDGSSQTEPPETVLTIGTADSGGTMYLAGSALAEVLERDGLRINVGASSGSAMNVKNLLSGEVDLALVSGDTALRAYEDADHGGTRLRAVGAVFFSQSNWIVPAESGLEYVHQLGGLRLGVGPERSGTERSALSSLAAVGLEPEEVQLENCGLGEGTERMLQGELDAIHGFSGAPIGALEQLTRQLPCRVLKYTEEELEAILAQRSVFVSAVLPAGTYRGQDEEVATFGVKCLLCVPEDMDEELVYGLTRSLWESRQTLAAAHPSMAAMEQEGFISDQLPIPIHPGALRFYSEQN